MLASAATAWATLDLPARRGEWDETYGHIVTNKENGIAERQSLVAHVKNFATAYKEDPATERVEALLRYMKRFINALYERIEVAEEGFLDVYQKIALIDDPAPVLREVQAKLTENARRIAQLEAQLAEAEHGAATAQKACDAAIEAQGDLLRRLASTTANEGSKETVAELQRQVIALERDARSARSDRDALRLQVDSLQSQLVDEASAAAAAREEADEAASAAAGSGFLSHRTVSAPVDPDTLAAAIRRAIDERVQRLQASLDAARAEADTADGEARSAKAALEKATADHGAIVSALRSERDGLLAKLETADRRAQVTSSAQQAASPSANGTGEGCAHGSSNDERAPQQQQQQQLARRVATLEASLRRAHDDLAAEREKARENRLAELDRISAEMLASSPVIISSSAETQPPPHAGGYEHSKPDTSIEFNGPAAVSSRRHAASKPPAASSYLSDADFSTLLQTGGATDARKQQHQQQQQLQAALTIDDDQQPAVTNPSPPTASLSASEVATAAVLVRQRDALKKQLADAHNVVAQLKSQLAAPRFPAPAAAGGTGPSVFSSFMMAAPPSRCATCAKALSNAVGSGGGMHDAKDGVRGGRPAARKRDVAINVLDGVGAMLGSLLQVHRAARIIVVVYLCALHLVVFTTVTSWSAAAAHRHHQHAVASGHRRSGLANFEVTVPPATNLVGLN